MGWIRKEGSGVHLRELGVGWGINSGRVGIHASSFITLGT